MSPLSTPLPQDDHSVPFLGPCPHAPYSSESGCTLAKPSLLYFCDMELRFGLRWHPHTHLAEGEWPACACSSPLSQAFLVHKGASGSQNRCE